MKPRNVTLINEVISFACYDDKMNDNDLSNACSVIGITCNSKGGVKVKIAIIRDSGRSLQTPLFQFQ